MVLLSIMLFRTSDNTVSGEQAVSELDSTDKTVGLAVVWIDSNF
jgi:hypothetical protein